MRGNFTLGRLGGVEVRVNVFPSQNPGLSRGVHLAMALVAAVLFFGSLLLHELGHAWQARREGVASAIGVGFGYLFIGLGVAMFFVQGGFSGAWLAFIGWFLIQSARAEARYVATEEARAVELRRAQPQ
jgi:Zn-dependent protease